MASLSTSFGPTLKYVIKPYLFPPEHWLKIIRVAKDLKQAVADNKKKSLNLLDTKHVTLMSAKPHGRYELAYTLACDLLGARRTLYCDPYFEKQIFPGDGGKVLSLLTDMLVFHGLHQDVLRKTVSKVTVPVFSASCDVYCLHKILSDMMTFWETYDQLHGLTFAWVGPPNSIFNTYLMLCSKFGIKVQYLCMCKFGAGRMSPVLGQPTEDKTYVKEFQTVEETVSGAHIIATSMHPETKNKITLEHFKKADSRCVFMHSLPRGSAEVSEELFAHENNLSWKTTENYVYIAMAIILTSLEDYQPKSTMPTSDCF